MPITNMQLITLTGKFYKLNGAPAAGTITFSTTKRVVNTASNEIIVPKDHTVTLNGSGAFSIQLPATNDPDFSPTFKYTVTERFTGYVQKSYEIELPHNLAGATVDLADIIEGVLQPPPSAPRTPVGRSVGLVWNTLGRLTVSDTINLVWKVRKTLGASRIFYWDVDRNTGTTVTPIWTATHEGGTTSEWSQNGGGGIFNSGNWSTSIVSDIKHSGTRSLRGSITAPPIAGHRCFRWDELHDHRELYLSAWLYLPVQYSLSGSWRFCMLWQFKASNYDKSRNDPFWALHVKVGSGGIWQFKAVWGNGGVAVPGPYSNSDLSVKNYDSNPLTTVPIGRWFHMESFIRQSYQFDGIFRHWVDGVQIFNFTNIRTGYESFRTSSFGVDQGWAPSLYSDGLSPSPASMYVDDAKISLQRYGPN